MTDMDMKNTPKAKITGDALIDLLDKKRDDANIHCSDQSGSLPCRRCEQLRRALQRISFIQNRCGGGDWDEIEEARNIADSVL